MSKKLDGKEMFRVENKRSVGLLALLVVTLIFILAGCTTTAINSDNGSASDSSSSGDSNSNKQPSVDPPKQKTVTVTIYLHAKVIETMTVTHNSIVDISEHLVGRQVNKASDNLGAEIQVNNGKIQIENNAIFVFLIEQLPKYNISSDYDNNLCTIDIDSHTATVGQKVYFTVEVQHDYYINSIEIKSTSGRIIELEQGQQGENKYSFIMPTANVTIYIECKPSTFKITAHSSQNISMEISQQARFGDRVSGKLDIQKGYSLDKLIIVDSMDNKLDVAIQLSGNEFSFIMPSQDISIRLEQLHDEHDLEIEGLEGIIQEKVHAKLHYDDTINIIFELEQGYQLKEILAYNADRQPIALEYSITDNGATAVMPDNDTIIHITAKKIDYTITTQIIGVNSVSIDNLQDSYNYNDKVSLQLKYPQSYKLLNITITGENQNISYELKDGTLTFVMPSESVKIAIELWDSLSSVWFNFINNLNLATHTKFILSNSIFNFGKLDKDKYSGFDNNYACQSEMSVTELPHVVLGNNAKNLLDKAIIAYNKLVLTITSDLASNIINNEKLIYAQLSQGEFKIKIGGIDYKFILNQKGEIDLTATSTDSHITMQYACEFDKQNNMLISERMDISVKDDFSYTKQKTESQTSFMWQLYQGQQEPTSLSMDNNPLQYKHDNTPNAIAIDNYMKTQDSYSVHASMTTAGQQLAFRQNDNGYQMFDLGKNKIIEKYNNQFELLYEIKTNVLDMTCLGINQLAISFIDTLCATPYMSMINGVELYDDGCGIQLAIQKYSYLSVEADKLNLKELYLPTIVVETMNNTEQEVINRLNEFILCYGGTPL